MKPASVSNYRWSVRKWTQRAIPAGWANRVTWFRPLVGFLLIGLIAEGCTCYQTQPAKATGGTYIFSFLEPGHTTRAELRSEWGPPSASLESGRIDFYRLAGSASFPRFVDEIGPWENTHYSLVLVFNQSGILTNSSLVRVR